MGVDKARLELVGETLAARAVRILGAQFDRIIVITGDPVPFQGLPVELVADPPERRDPMGAILTGWEYAQPSSAFVAAVDMPGLDAGVIERFLDVAASYAGVSIVAPVGVRGFEPLHALYRESAIDVMRRRHAAGLRSLQGLVDAVAIERIPVAALAAGAWAFRSVNTPEDCVQWENSAHG